MYSRISISAAFASLCALFSGCINLDPVADPTQTYILVAPEIAKAGTFDSAVDSLYVERVEIPPYLDDRRLAVRVSENKMRYLEFDRWAEPLGQGIARTIALNFLQLPGIRDIGYYPWRDDNPEAFRLRVQVFAFEKRVDGPIRFNGLAEIVDPGRDGGVRFSFPFSIRTPVESDSTEAQVAAMSRAVAEMVTQFVEASKDQ